MKIEKKETYYLSVSREELVFIRDIMQNPSDTASSRIRQMMEAVYETSKLALED